MAFRAYYPISYWIDRRIQRERMMLLRLEDGNERDLLNEMADKKSVGSSGVSGLRSAVNSGYVERLLAFLDAGADIDAKIHG